MSSDKQKQLPVCSWTISVHHKQLGSASGKVRVSLWNLRKLAINLCVCAKICNVTWEKNLKLLRSLLSCIVGSPGRCFPY